MTRGTPGFFAIGLATGLLSEERFLFSPSRPKIKAYKKVPSLELDHAIVQISSRHRLFSPSLALSSSFSVILYCPGAPPPPTFRIGTVSRDPRPHPEALFDSFSCSVAGGFSISFVGVVWGKTKILSLFVWLSVTGGYTLLPLPRSSHRLLFLAIERVFAKPHPPPQRKRRKWSGHTSKRYAPHTALR